MLKSLKLTGFQAHADSVIEFVPGVNIITGLNDDGKTSIIRGINFPVSNRPLGDGIINYDMPSAQSELQTDEGNGYGCTVIRHRGKSVNNYKLRRHTPDGDDDTFFDEPLTGFGTTVPEEVTEALKIRDINIQEQLDKHFLVLDSPGSVAAYIRKVIGIDDIDETMTVINGRIVKTKTKLDQVDENICSFGDDLAEIEKTDLDGIEVHIKAIEAFSERIAEIELKEERLSALIASYEEVREELALLPGDLSKFKTEIVIVSGDITKNRSDFLKLSRLLRDIDEVKAELAEIPEDIEGTAALYDELIEELQTRREAIGKLNELIMDLEDVQETEMQLCEQVGQTKLRISELLPQLESCPYCETELTGRTRALLIAKNNED